MSKLIIVDTALTDVDGLVAAAAEYLARRLGGTPPLDPAALPADAAAALAAIDVWAGAGAANWRTELTRWFEAHAPVLLVPDPELNGILRRAAKAVPLDLELQQLGCARAFHAACAGDGSLDDAISAAQAALGGHDTPVARTRADVVAALGA
jgi:hypothetical protein